MKTNESTNACPKCGGPVPAEAPQGLCPKCVMAQAMAAEAAPTATVNIPSLERLAVAFPQLQILELIGRGGMGFVFKARQPHLDRFVALKLLPDSLAHDPQFAERFNREGRVLARLNHPNIVSIFDFGQAGGFYYLMMEYVDGVNLRQAMQAGRFSPAEALTIVPKICEALQFAHEEGVLHRDIKPENILLDAKGRVKIADFGIAKLVGEEHPDVSLTATGAALGTMHYMAPEQIEKPSTVDHRADIYSLGVVFYELLTGELPLGRFGPPSAKTPVDSRVDDVVMRTLEREREKRFQSAGEMGTTVEHLTEVGAGTFKSAPPREPSLTSTPAQGPRGTIVIGHPSLVKRPAQALLVTGILNWIGSIIVVALLLYTSLGQTWILSPSQLVAVGVLILLSSSVIIIGALKMMKLEAYPLAVVASMLAMITTPGSIIGLPIGLWALITLRRADVRTAFESQVATRLSGVLALLVFGVGFVITTHFRGRQTEANVSGPNLAGDTNTTPWIRFTFTAVELREVQGVRWLVIDYLDDVHGECQKSFPWETTIPGFKPVTRATEFLKEGDKDSPPVRHQRIEYRMPDSSPRDQLERLRDNLEKALKQKSFRLELRENEIPLLLFELPGVEGGSLQARIKVVPPLQTVPATPQRTLGALRLVGAGSFQNIALINLESMHSHPLHYITARFSGPELPQEVALAPKAVNGPYVVPSANEDIAIPVTEPIANGDPVGTNQAPTASAIRVECPGIYSMSFVLPDENAAREADRQIKIALAGALTLKSGQPIVLFTVGERKAWLEVHPFYPAPNKFAFFRHGGRSPAIAASSNHIECAVATIPPGHELKLVGRLMLNGQNRPEPTFGTTLTSGPNEPGVYWLTWYSLPNPQTMDDGVGEDWELLVHDATGHELLRVQAPEGLKRGWSRRWVGDSRRTAKAGEPIQQILFQKVETNIAGDRRPSYVNLEMTMHRSGVPDR